MTPALTPTELSDCLGVLANLPALLVVRSLGDGRPRGLGHFVAAMGLPSDDVFRLVDRLDDAGLVIVDYLTSTFTLNRSRIAAVAAAVNALGAGPIAEPHHAAGNGPSCGCGPSGCASGRSAAENATAGQGGRS